MSRTPALQPVPDGVLTPADYEAHARARLEPRIWNSIEAHAGAGHTRRANAAAWDARALWPRVLRTPARVDSRCELLGRVHPSPLLVAPMALQCLAHPDGELAMALAAAAQGVGLVLSCQASQSLESVAAAMRPDPGRGPLWFQLYLLADRGATLELVRRAEAAGYEALVLTVDAPVRAPRRGDLAGALPPGVRPVNLPAAPSGRFEDRLAHAPGWADVAWLAGQTRLPLLLKGVLHPADAREALNHPVRGLIVSNHGGRVIDTAAATAHALPRIVEAVGGALPLLVDGGLRSGTDIAKALALGARAVLVGRPALWGLAAAGAAGAAHVLRLLRDELAIAMALCGAATPDALGPGLLLD